MKTSILYLAVVAVIVTMSCCSPTFTTYELSSDYATSLHYSGSSADGGSEEILQKGVPAIGYYNGDLLAGAIWWKRRGLKINKDDEFEVRADSAVNVPFGATFPPLDFTTEKLQLKVTCMAIGKDGADATLQLQMVDARGYHANAPVNVITNSGDFKEYYFDLFDIYNQATPEVFKVNGGFINSLELYVNPKGPAFYGKIIIEEIKVVKAKKDS